MEVGRRKASRGGEGCPVASCSSGTCSWCFHLHSTGSRGDRVRSQLQPLKSRMGAREQGDYSPETGVVHLGQHCSRMSPRGSWRPNVNPKTSVHLEPHPA